MQHESETPAAPGREGQVEPTLDIIERLYATGCDLQIHPSVNRQHDWLNEVVRLFKRILDDRARLVAPAPASHDAPCECCGKCGADVNGDVPLCDRCAKEIGQRLHAEAKQPASPGWPEPRYADNGARIVIFDTPWYEPHARDGIFTDTGALVIERQKWMTDVEWTWFRDFILSRVNAPVTRDHELEELRQQVSDLSDQLNSALEAARGDGTRAGDVETVPASDHAELMRRWMLQIVEIHRLKRVCDAARAYATNCQEDTWNDLVAALTALDRCRAVLSSTGFA